MLPRLLGIERFRGDSVRRAFEKQDEDAMTLWMDRHTNETYAALLEEEWILGRSVGGRRKRALAAIR